MKCYRLLVKGDYYETARALKANDLVGTELCAQNGHTLWEVIDTENPHIDDMWGYLKRWEDAAVNTLIYFHEE